MSKSYSLQARYCVQRGARWLDENFPEWTTRIDLDTLELSEANQCICGQVFADRVEVEGTEETDPSFGIESGFDYANTHLFAEANSWISVAIPKGEIFRANKVSRYLGFMESDFASFHDLQRNWVRFLERRKAGIA